MHIVGGDLFKGSQTYVVSNNCIHFFHIKFYSLCANIFYHVDIMFDAFIILFRLAQAYA